MSKKKHQHIDGSQETTKTQSPSESTKRHVYVEAGAQIDFVKDIRQEYTANQTESSSLGRKQLFWTRISAALLFIYVALTLWMAFSAQRSLDEVKDQFIRDQRPYITITKFLTMDSDTHTTKTNDEFEVGKPAEVNVAFKNIGKGIAVDTVFHYHLVFGKNINQIKVEPADHQGGGGTVDPGEEGVATAVGLRDPYSREDAGVNLAEVLDWDGSEPVIVYGRISYRDIAGNSYCLPFLAQKVPLNWGRGARIGNISQSDL